MGRPEEILEALDALPPAERRQFHALLAQSKRSRGDDGVFSREERYLADALFQITRNRLPNKALIDLGLRPKTIELFDYLENQIADLREPQIAELTRLCISALADHLQARRSPVPVTSKTLLEHMGRISLAVERAYPGYHRAGILKMLVLSVTDTAA